jgi:glutamyl-tRNA synthetase
VRFRASGVIEMVDHIVGTLSHDLPVMPGDFVLRRRDELYAYQFAVVVDDAAMGVTEIVRGHDLLDSTPRQFALFDALGEKRPSTWHVPLLVNKHGDRLSKRTHSVSLRGLEDAGWDSAAMRGLLAWLWGWRDRVEPMSADALVAAWSPSTLATPQIRVPDAVYEGPQALRKFTREDAAGQLGVE